METITPTHTNLLSPTHQFLTIKASTHPQPRRIRPTTKTPPAPPPPKQRDPFPASLPLHSRDPIIIHNDITRFAKQNKLKQAFTILHYMDQKGLRTNPATFASLISACARLKSLDQGRLVHKYIKINGLETDPYLCTKLAKMYTICKSVDDVKRVLEECGSEDVYKWNGVLRGNVLKGWRRYKDVISTYSEMRSSGMELNEYTFSNVIKSFSGAAAYRQGTKAHALLIKNGLVRSPVLWTGLVYLYFKCGKVQLANRMFDEFGGRDVVAWGAVIAGLAQNRLNREALDCARRMVREGIWPNRVVLTTILPVIGEICRGDNKLGREVHAYVVKTRSYDKQVVVRSALIEMYCKSGDMDMGRRVFYGSRERNVITWTALMSGYAANGRREEALRSVVWMQQEGFMPDVVTVVTVIPVCAELRAVRAGKELHAYAVKNRFLPNVAVETSLMVMYSKCGNLEYTARLFRTMEYRNVRSWTAVIESYVDNGCLDEALDAFRSIHSSRHRPDSVLIGRMLSLCGKARALRLGKELHGHVLKKNFDSIPFVSSEIIRMYGSCGSVCYARNVFSRVPVKGTMTWSAIMEAYGDNGCHRDTIRLFYRMVDKGFPISPSVCTMALSVCDRAGFAGDACRIFNLMSTKWKMKPSDEHYSTIVNLLTRIGRVEEAERYVRMRSSISSWE